MKKKHQFGMFVAMYEREVAEAGGSASKDDLFEKLKPALRKFNQDNEDAALLALFERIEKRAFAGETVDERQGTLPGLNLDAVIPLGDQTRSLYRYCDRDMLEKRRAVLKENRDAVVAQADKEIGAIDRALAIMKPGDLLEDIQL